MTLVSSLFVALGLASPAVDELDARLHVHGDACPDAVLAERVRALLPSPSAAAVIDVDGTLRLRDDGQWELELVIARGDEEPTVRSFVAPHCATAIDAAALVVAIAIDPTREVAVPESPPPSEPTPKPAPVVAAPPTTPTPSEPEPAPGPKPRTRKVRGLVRGGGGIDGGALPGVSAFFEIAVGATGRFWRAELTGIRRLQSEARAEADHDAGGRFSLWAVGARVCGVPDYKKLEFPLCAAIEGGQMVVDGFGFEGHHTTRRPWAAVSFGPGLAWVVHRNVAIVLQGALGVPLVRSEISIDNLEVLHTTGPVFGRGMIGFEGRFP